MDRIIVYLCVNECNCVSDNVVGAWSLMTNEWRTPPGEGAIVWRLARSWNNRTLPGVVCFLHEIGVETSINYRWITGWMNYDLYCNLFKLILSLALHVLSLCYLCLFFLKILCFKIIILDFERSDEHDNLSIKCFIY